MKIDSLLENVTPSSTPVGNNPSSTPKFGRDPKVLEDDKLDETTAGATGSGSVASISHPIGNLQKRQGTGALLKGIKTSEKFPNSKAVKEEEIKEQDIILNPALGKSPKPGFHNRKDHEGDTVKNSLFTIVQAAKELNDAIENTTQFPEWVSEKIGAIKHMMVVVKDYVRSQQKRGDDNIIDEEDNQYVLKDPKSFLDDDFYAFDPKTKVIKDVWGYKSVGRSHSEYRAEKEGWQVAPGLRAKHLGLLIQQRNTNEGGFDIPDIPRAPTPKPVPKNGVAEGQLELNTPDPVVVVADPKTGKMLDTLNLSLASQKYKLGSIENIKKQLAHQPYTIVGNYRIQAPVGGQPQDSTTKNMIEGTAQEKLHKRHQELRKKSGLPDVNYYKELMATYDLPDQERIQKQQEIKQKYKVK